MLVLLKTAFYVAGWVMGVNGSANGFSVFCCFGVEYIAQFHPITFILQVPTLDAKYYSKLLKPQ